MEGDLGMSLNAPSGGIRANLHFVRQKKTKKSKSGTNLKKKRNNEKIQGQPWKACTKITVGSKDSQTFTNITFGRKDS
jgi:hypothetical protein